MYDEEARNAVEFLERGYDEWQFIGSPSRMRQPPEGCVYTSVVVPVKYESRRGYHVGPMFSIKGDLLASGRSNMGPSQPIETTPIGDGTPVVDTARSRADAGAQWAAAMSMARRSRALPVVGWSAS